MHLIDNQINMEFVMEQFYHDLFVMADVQKIPLFYSNDVIGYLPTGHTFNFSDINNKIFELFRDTEGREAEIIKIRVTNSEVQCLTNLRWLMKNEGSSHKWQLFASYRFDVNHKICEVWLSSEQTKSGSFKDESITPIQYFTRQAIKNSEFNTLIKLAFFERLKSSKIKDLYIQEKFTEVELDCLFFYYYGLSAKEISLEMGLTPRTVERYLTIIKEKIDVSNRYQLRLKLNVNPRFIWE